MTLIQERHDFTCVCGRIYLSRDQAELCLNRHLRLLPELYSVGTAVVYEDSGLHGTHIVRGTIVALKENQEAPFDSLYLIEEADESRVWVRAYTFQWFHDDMQGLRVPKQILSQEA